MCWKGGLPSPKFIKIQNNKNKNEKLILLAMKFSSSIVSLALQLILLSPTTSVFAGVRGASVEDKDSSLKQDYPRGESKAQRGLIGVSEIEARKG